MGFLDTMAMQEQMNPGIDPSMQGAPGLLADQPPPFMPMDQSHGLVAAQPPGPSADLGGTPGIVPHKMGFVDRLAKTVGSDGWDTLAAQLQDFDNGDTAQQDALMKRQEFRDSRKVKQQAADDMEAEAAAAREATKDGGWNQQAFDRKWGERKRPPNVERVAALAKLYGVETGIEGDTPWSRKQGASDVQWGTPRPVSPREQAKMQADEEERLRRDADRDENIRLRELALRLSQQLGGRRADISEGQLGVARQREAREAAGGGGGGAAGGVPDFSKMTQEELQAYGQGFGKK
jgi:hypothetical protein